MNSWAAFWTSDAAPAWIQAIGSVAAIFASYWLFKIQQNDHVKRVAKSVATVVEDAEFDAESFHNDFEGIDSDPSWYATTQLALEAFVAKRNVLERLNLAAIDDPLFWKIYARFLAQLDALIRLLRVHEGLSTQPAEANAHQGVLALPKSYLRLLANLAKDTHRALESAYNFGPYRPRRRKAVGDHHTGQR